jgi:hypothetical protein
MVENREYVLKRSAVRRVDELPQLLEKEFGGRLLRWFVSKVTDGAFHVEITLCEEGVNGPDNETGNTFYPGKSVVLSLVPTGIGCSIGGYAADAAPATALLSYCCDYLITNPNAVNASDFIFLPENVLYCEGYLIDQFSRGRLNLYRPYANKVGLIVNTPTSRELEAVFNIMNTVRAVHGIDIEDYVITEESFGGRCVKNKSGSYVGNIERPDILFRACDKLIERGVNAIAVTSNIKDLPMSEYADHFDGLHPNPIGGAEAVISHLICRKYRLPAAHAPLSNVKELDLRHRVVDARGAGEFSSFSGLACVLIGLRRAPQVMGQGNFRVRDILNIHNVLAVVAPATALGGIPMLFAKKYGIPVIAVKENRTILEVDGSGLNLDNVYEVNSYPEAAGVVTALKQGISVRSLYRPLATLRF